MRIRARKSPETIVSGTSPRFILLVSGQGLSSARKIFVDYFPLAIDFKRHVIRDFHVRVIEHHFSGRRAGASVFAFQ